MGSQGEQAIFDIETRGVARPVVKGGGTGAKPPLENFLPLLEDKKVALP